MTGKIIKGIAGFYYVHVVGSGVYECKAKGIFRKLNKKPLVGDNVTIDVIDEEGRIGNIRSLLPRENELLRPTVANVDEALVIFACKSPDPNFNLLDRFLIRMQLEGIPSVIIFNKCDLISEEERAKLTSMYEHSGADIIFASTITCEGIDDIRDIIKDKTATVAGPSGVGKSSIVNMLQDGIEMETGDISKKIERGKHTTRHSELIPVCGNTYIVDTPGFSTLYINELTKEELKEYYQEFTEYSNECRFLTCNHISEPDCGVKDALHEGRISKDRYDNYLLLFEELKNIKRF